MTAALELSELEWELAAMQRIHAVLGHLGGLPTAWDQGVREWLTAAVGIEEASEDGLEWFAAHPCSDPALEAAVGCFFASQLLALHSLSVALHRWPDDVAGIYAGGGAIGGSMRGVAASLDYLRCRLPLP